jgi:hypothetical protein
MTFRKLGPFPSSCVRGESSDSSEGWFFLTARMSNVLSPVMIGHRKGSGFWNVYITCISNSEQINMSHDRVTLDELSIDDSIYFTFWYSGGLHFTVHHLTHTSVHHCRCLVPASNGELHRPLGSRTAPGLSYQLLTVTVYNDWTPAVLWLNLKKSKLSYDRRSVGQSVLVSSICQGSKTRFLFLSGGCCLLVWGAMSNYRTGLSFTIAAGPHQRSHSRVRVPQDS